MKLNTETAKWKQTFLCFHLDRVCPVTNDQRETFKLTDTLIET